MEEKVSIQEENNKKYFDDNIFLLINKYKETNYESVLRKNNYCDININNKWTVGKIKNLKDDTATIINLDNEDNDIKVYLFQADKISYLRKYSKPNDRRTYSKRDDLQDLDTI
jgi:predicted RNA-binding protein with EMAP domain